MSIDKQTVARIAHLARIAVDDAGQERLKGELSGILAWVEQLNELDTSHVAPLTSVTGHALPMREDAVSDGGDADTILANAPEKAADFFVVPKVIE